MTNETSETGGIYAEMQKMRGVISEESFVKKDGLTILIKEVNFYCRYGEIDIVAFNENKIICEENFDI